MTGKACVRYNGENEKAGARMIVVNLDVMLAKRKMSVTELSQQVGITMANISILKNGKSKAIRLSTLDAICTVLQCQPGDVLEWRPEQAGDGGCGTEVPEQEPEEAPARDAEQVSVEKKRTPGSAKKRPAAAPQYFTVSRLNLRDQASRSGSVVEKLPGGAPVELLEKQGQWARVRWEDKSGWVLAAYLKEQGQD